MKTSTPLWEYACALYEKQGVQQACLQLQDDHRVNVPLILFFCWAMTVKGGIDGQVLKQAAHRADIVDTTLTGALRGIRRGMKQASFAQAQWQKLRQAVVDSELQSERLLLADLESFYDQAQSVSIHSLAAALNMIYPTLDQSDAIIKQHLSLITVASSEVAI